ncbi:unnamed protein product [Ilex paraguariensis]|uniref:Uncharacterized protein n=1 Tax=Ilex paraguariensis TaxID=185542 RepID=A0ABC8T8W9_9AQUA
MIGGVNHYSDEDAPGGTPVMQSSVPDLQTYILFFDGCKALEVAASPSFGWTICYGFSVCDASVVGIIMVVGSDSVEGGGCGHEIEGRAGGKGGPGVGVAKSSAGGSFFGGGGGCVVWGFNCRVAVRRSRRRGVRASDLGVAIGEAILFKFFSYSNMRDKQDIISTLNTLNASDVALMFLLGYLTNLNQFASEGMLFALQKEKPLRRRLGPDNRTKDERGNRRELDNRANGGERYDRSENQQSTGFQSSNDGPVGDNPDDPMFDTFGAQGINVAPFPSDIPPPPVLMPVPGAG